MAKRKMKGQGVTCTAANLAKAASGVFGRKQVEVLHAAAGLDPRKTRALAEAAAKKAAENPGVTVAAALDRIIAAAAKTARKSTRRREGAAAQ